MGFIWEFPILKTSILTRWHPPQRCLGGPGAGVAAEIAVPSKALEGAAAAAAGLSGSWDLGSGEGILQQLLRNYSNF